MHLVGQLLMKLSILSDIVGGAKRDEVIGDCRKYYEFLYLYPSNIIRVIKWRMMKLEMHVAHTWCCRKVMRLATLCTNRQRCHLPLHMAVRLTPDVDSVQVWTCYSCYAIVESVWSEVVFVRCVTKMDRAKVWAMLCHQILCKAWRIRYCDLWKVTKGLWRTFPIQGTRVQMTQVLFRSPRTRGRRTSCLRTFNLKNGRQCGKSEVSCEVRSPIAVDNDQ